MKKLVLIALLMAALLTGCVAPLPTEETVPPVVEATNTPVPPPPTDTPVPPTPTPTFTPTPIPDLNAVMVNAGFTPTTPLLPVGFVIGDLLAVTDSISYTKSDANEDVHTIVLSLPTALEIAGFQMELADPNYTLLAIVAALEGVGMQPEVDLAGAVTVGQMSKGVTFTTTIGGTLMRVDVVLFMEGTSGAIVVVVYPDGSTPTVDAWTVAGKLDERIKSQ